MPITMPFWLFLLISLVLWVGTWLIQKSLQPYVKARSELRAREDKLDAILNEVRNVTHVQKEIESKITGRDWNRQRAYELRRDCYIELLRTLGELAIAARESFAFAPEGKITPQPTEEFRKVDDRITACSYKLNTQHFLYRALLGDRVSS